MRLIDADVYCATICRCNRRACDKAKCPIHNAPTACDIDKVVEELKTDSSVKLYGSGNSDNYLIPVKRAIEIVKQGGVGTETETIRDKAVKWNNNSSKRVPYEFIDYVEGKRDIGVSDDVCEWEKSKDYPFGWLVGCEGCEVTHRQGDYCPMCGKKIKVVE